MDQRTKKNLTYTAVLLRQLVITDFKIRYQGSALGYLWTILRPLALFGILYVVFVKFIGIGSEVPHYPVYLLLGIVLWNYFLEVTTGSISAIVSKGSILRKINFPKYVIVLAGSFSALINLAINFVVVLFFMFVSNVNITGSIILFPIIVLELFILAIGMAFFLSALFVRLRDVNYIWDVIIQGAFYLTPILYPLSLVGDNYAKILVLSPIAQIIQDARYVVVTKDTITISTLYQSWYPRIIPICITIFIALFSFKYFKNRAKYFAEEV